VARVFVTGSTAGLGRAAAEELLDGGHEVGVHARSAERAASVDDLAQRGARVVIGDLASREDTRAVADQVNAVTGIDAVIHNAAIYVDDRRLASAEGHARTLAVNVLAPYLLTAWIDGPSRLIYLTSGMHHSGDTSLRNLDWTARRWSGVQAYCDSKLYLTTLALALARRWPRRLVHAVDPGWVPTRMGGPGAPDDLGLGADSQVWLAAGDDPAADVTARYVHHRRSGPVPAVVGDEQAQEALFAYCAELTGTELPQA
jgi:NAD(P)-dependent dehydrogenase (short-subunit alcohol dehydrogenase family)